MTADPRLDTVIADLVRTPGHPFHALAVALMYSEPGEQLTCKALRNTLGAACRAMLAARPDLAADHPVAAPNLEPMPRPLPWQSREDVLVHGFAQGVVAACDELDRQVGGAGDPRVEIIRRKASPMARDWLLAAKARGAS